MLSEEGGLAFSNIGRADSHGASAEDPSRLRLIPASLAAPHPGLWILTVLLIVLDAIWLSLSGIRLQAQGFAIGFALVAVLLVAAALLGPIKSEPKLRAMALASASLVAFTLPLAVLHYLTATLPLPFADETLARVEAALGFDWVAYIAFLAAHPSLSWWLALAYHSSGPQIAVVVIVLSACSQLGRLWTFVRLYAALMLCSVVVAAIVPAIGPYAHFKPGIVPADQFETVGAVWHLEPLNRLREGTMRVIALEDIRGLVTFPSFHVCLAIISAWALAPVPMIGPLAALLNIAVIVATIGSGGHYLPDVLAGSLLSLLILSGQRLSRGRSISWPRVRQAAYPLDRAASPPRTATG